MSRKAFWGFFSFIFFSFLFFSFAAFADEVSVFGPETYTTQTGKPVTVTNNFPASEGTGRIYIRNGSQDGENRISSAVIKLNGVEIFGTSDFNQPVYELEEPASLLSENTLSIELRSSPGSFLTITIFQEEVEPPSLLPTATFELNPSEILQGESATLTWSTRNAHTAYFDNGIGMVDLSGSLDVSPTHTATYTLTVSGPYGTTSVSATIKIISQPEPLPEYTFGSNYSDLIPPDATVSSYDPKRFSVVTGLVQSISGTALPGVSVTVHNHPEYGTVTTDAEGRFSLPVDGGGFVTLVYKKEGYLTSHRQVNVSWNEIAIAETIRMLQADTHSTTLSFDGSPASVITHTGTEITDEFGSRASTIVFKGDNRAYLVDENGNDVYELPAMQVRATEYKTPDSMPAVLPPTSAYTYCVELSADGAERIRFEKPVAVFVDNFLGFPVGGIVPVGYYDRDRAVWVPSENGVVVMLLDTDSDGVVDALDSDNDGQPNDLNNDGSFLDEVSGLDDPVRFAPGRTFWRFETTHFSPWDCNWGFGPPGDAIDPNPTSDPYNDPQLPKGEDDKKCTGSYVEQRSRIFHEDISIPGTDMTLHYASNRVKGYKHKITVPASGETVPESLKRIIVRVKVAGRTFEQELEALPNQKVEISWDGLDWQGKSVVGSTLVKVHLGFVYDLLYKAPSNLEWAFGQSSSSFLDVTVLGRDEFISWKSTELTIQVNNFTHMSSSIANGWTISEAHFLDKFQKTVYKGNGSIIDAKHGIITTVVGNGQASYHGDGGLATGASLNHPNDVTIDKAGNIYIADTYNYRIRKVDTSGIITTVAGNGQNDFCGDGGPATEACLEFPGKIFVDNTGNIYITATSHLRKVDTNGIISTIAGSTGWCSHGDGGLATEACLSPEGVAIDNAGNLYIADFYNHRIRKVDTNGIITTVAGNGQQGYCDGEVATGACLNYPKDVAIDKAGNIYIAESFNPHRISKTDISGVMTTVAGRLGACSDFGDGVLATEACLNIPSGVEIDKSGNIYIADTANNRIRKVDTSGVITTVAGNGNRSCCGDDGLPIEASLNYPMDIAIDNTGNIYIADGGNNRIREVSFLSTILGFASDELVLPDENGLGYIIHESGRHERTIDLDTQATIYEFGYDSENRLITITDRFGRSTVINRDSNGNPVSIVSPDGLTTNLIIDADNNLTRITHPDGSSYNFEYTQDGLMTAKVEPNGNRFEHAFDENGRVTDVTNQEGGNWHYEKEMLETGEILTWMTSAEGNVISYLDRFFSTGDYSSIVTDATGAETSIVRSANGLEESKILPCGMETYSKYNFDSFYKSKYLEKLIQESPSGLSMTMNMGKTYEDTDADEVPDIITETTSLNGKTTTSVNNVSASTRTVTTPQGRSYSMQYDPVTLLTKSVSTPGLYPTSYQYDTNGRLTSVATNARVSSFTYDSFGYLSSITDPMGRTTAYVHDLMGRITGITRPDGSSIGYSYDPNGNMIVLTTPTTVNHGFGYNSINKKTSYTTPLSGSYQYVYDRDRRLTRIDFPSGARIQNIYANGRLSQVQTPEGNLNYSYLCGTKVGAISDGTDAVTYGYDGSLVISETLSGTINKTLSYTYNNDFNLTSFTYAGGTTNYSYDNDGLLTGSGAFTITRNADNGLPVSVAGGSLALSRSFNGYGEQESSVWNVGGSTVSSWNLTRNNNGRITEKTETVGGTSTQYAYGYDTLGRLTSVTMNGSLVEQYQYDSNGNRLYEMNSLRGISGRNYSFDAEDHLLTAGSVSYQFDADGFLTSKTDGADVTNYDYSSRGELLSVTQPDGTVISYEHDPLGRRIAKKINGVIQEKYLWQGFTTLLAVYDGSDNLLMRFEYADDRMPVAVMIGGATYYLSYDQIGTLKAVTDASGSVIKQIDYDSFGNIISDTNPSLAVPFGFAGGLHDRDTGLVRFGYRDYAPEIGRWTAKDPIFFAGGDTNLYGYVQNDPLNLYDPSGLFWPIDCEKCVKVRNKWEKAQEQCRKERNECKSLEDEVEFADKYGGIDDGSALWNCSIEKSGDPEIREKMSKFCLKCGFGVKAPPNPRPTK